MTTADRRRDAVARIIRSRRIGTQEELLEALAEAGFHATQATLSRDLARLAARRVSRPEGGTVYELGDGDGDGSGAPGPRGPAGLEALRGLVSSIAANASMVVVRTPPGSAPAIARAIDLAQLPEVLGTIAGDDTIFVAPAGELRPRRLASRLAELLGATAALGDGARPAAPRQG
ncbi:arginine repressor [Anaeromyxobacter oryzae]|uniref:Arginine repressor n=1 Tax=Anaeromyxobacter oryzae TaxID=2918170 RepID=A0ABM7WXQ5_9BACT|nr:arginine repressor [Anaeromyxobacter oryzae]BDG04236.1 arginine repressor [Anaeromyxobacter oryzae]